MEKSEPMDYASTGVDIDAESLAVSSLISALSKSPRKTGQKGAPVDLPGGFGGIIEFGDSRLALATDGVGSKLQLANELVDSLGKDEAVSILQQQHPDHNVIRDNSSTFRVIDQRSDVSRPEFREMLKRAKQYAKRM